MADAPRSWPEIAQWRKSRRAALIAARTELSQEAHRLASNAVLAHLTPVLATLRAPLIGIYWPIRREIDLRPFATNYIAAGSAVALPVILEKGRPLEFRLWWPETKLASGIWDIPYPAEGDAVTPQALLVPLVGFDAACYRLGYGGGYYDRTLASFAQKPLAIGLGFEFSRLDTIYPQPHDIAMDMIVTEAGFFRREDGRLISPAPPPL
jgi:5-formyltetrahydrofolate cyclo-ligase